MAECCVVEEHGLQVPRVGNRVHALLQGRGDGAEHGRSLRERRHDAFQPIFVRVDVVLV